MTPTIVLLLAAVAASDRAATPRPSALPALARKLRPLARSALGRAFLKAAEGAPPYAPRMVYGTPNYIGATAAWTTSPGGPSCGVHAPESRASATRIAL
jgi:hypothetical protein